MVPSSYLRIYRPLAEFPSRERSAWASYIQGGARHPKGDWWRHVAFSDHPLGILHPTTAEHAFIKTVNGQTFVCPWRTRLRVLVGLLTARNSLPYEIADAFVPQEVAEKAAGELEQLRSENSELRSYITTATWHVPLRWFIAFEADERMVTRERDRIRVRYETPLPQATERLRKGIEVLQSAGMAESVVAPVVEMFEWISEFSDSCLLELDYGSITSLFPSEDLVLDNSASEVWACLEALAAGDFDAGGRIYTDLAAWWGRARSVQSAN